MTFKAGDRIKVKPEIKLTDDDLKRGFAHGKIFEIIKFDRGYITIKGMHSFFRYHDFVLADDDMFNLDAIDE